MHPDCDNNCWRCEYFRYCWARSINIRGTIMLNIAFFAPFALLMWLR